MPVNTYAEVELAVEELLDKLERWLLQQPQWLLLMGLPERQVRRRVADLVAKELLMMPKREPTGFVPNRQMRRTILKELRKSEKRWFEGIELPKEEVAWTLDESQPER